MAYDLDPNGMDPRLLRFHIEALERENANSGIGGALAWLAVGGLLVLLVFRQRALAAFCFVLMLGLLGGTSWEKRRRETRLWHLRDALRRKTEAAGV